MRIFSCFFILLLFSCSTKKNLFFNRHYHRLKSSYNILFHAQKDYQEALDELISRQENDLYHLIFPSIIPYIEQKEEEIIEKSQQLDDLNTFSFFLSEKLEENKPIFNDPLEGFLKVEKKARKAIDNHAIYIRGKHYNDKISEAYFLLGKSRYFQSKSFLALESFDYLLKHFRKSPLIPWALIWKARVYLQLKEYDQVIKLLDEIEVRKEKKSITLQEELSHLKIQISIEKKEYKKAIESLKNLLHTNLKNKDRYHFLISELYFLMQEKTLAYTYLNPLVKKSTLGDFYLRAFIALAKGYDKGNNATKASKYISHLEGLLKNPFFYQKKAFIYEVIGDVFKGIKEYEKSHAAYEKALLLFSSYNKASFFISRVYKAIAENYLYQLNFKVALEFYQKAFERASKDSKKSLFKIGTNLKTFIGYYCNGQEKKLIISLTKLNKDQIDLTLKKELGLIEQNCFNSLDEDNIKEEIELAFKDPAYLETLIDKQYRLKFLTELYYPRLLKNEDEIISFLEALLDEPIKKELKKAIYYSLYKILKEKKSIKALFYENQIKREFPHIKLLFSP